MSDKISVDPMEHEVKFTTIFKLFCMYIIGSKKFSNDSIPKDVHFHVITVLYWNFVNILLYLEKYISSLIFNRFSHSYKIEHCSNV